MNFAVLASGRGSNLKNIIDAVKAGRVHADLKIVISDKKDAYALEHARAARVPAVHIDPKAFKDRESFDHEIVRHLTQNNVDFIVLAGYMRILSPYFVRQFPNKILNIHPSLLPVFKGTHALKEAFEYGVKVTGPTVHFVTEEMDAGAIILQEPVLVDAGDTLKTLEEKVHQAEYRIYPKAIELFVSGKIRIEGRKVIGP